MLTACIMLLHRRLHAESISVQHDRSIILLWPVVSCVAAKESEDDWPEKATETYGKIHTRPSVCLDTHV